jgi:hypothetical protein
MVGPLLEVQILVYLFEGAVRSLAIDCLDQSFSRFIVVRDFISNLFACPRAP